MKILHTADWHLGKKLEHISRLEEQREVLSEIIEIADREKVDAVVIAGDLFDNYNPSAEAVDLFYQTLKALSNHGRRAVVAIAGNHDAPERIEAPNPLAKVSGILLSGYPHTTLGELALSEGIRILRSAPGFVELRLPKAHAPLRLILTPYANEFRFRKYLGIEDNEEALRQILSAFWQNLAQKYCDDKGVNLLVAHLFFAGKRQKKLLEPEGEKPILHLGGAQAIFPENLPDGVHYTALGHLHRPQEVTGRNCPIVYCGSPLAYSFSEAGQKKRVVIIEAEAGTELQYRSIQLSKGRSLVRKKFREVEAAAKWLTKNPDSIAELTMITKNYLSAGEKTLLFDANPDIFIIPQPLEEVTPEENVRNVNLNQRIEDLFADYFSYRNDNQEPGKEIMDLLKEILAE